MTNESHPPTPGQAFIVQGAGGATEIRKVFRYDDVSGDGEQFVVTDQQNRRWLLRERDNREPGPSYIAVRELNPSHS